MSLVKSKFEAARRASGLTQEKAAELVKLSKQGYINREKEPIHFRLCEIEGLYNGMTDTAKPILRDAVMDIFLPDE